MKTNKAIEIKNSAISDVNLIVEMAIEQAETGVCLFDTLKEYQKNTCADTPNKKEQSTCDFIFYSHNSEVLEERFSLKYDQFEMNFDAGQAIFLSRKIKNGLGNGKSKQPTKNKASELNFNSKELQTNIADYRDDYHGFDYLMSEQNKSRKKAVVLAHKKAAKNDPIRLCWKWITSNKKVEGIHIPYKNEPMAIFTPKKECAIVPMHINECLIAI